jgi:hypothetical protein
MLTNFRLDESAVGRLVRQYGELGERLDLLLRKSTLRRRHLGDVRPTGAVLLSIISTESIDEFSL